MRLRRDVAAFETLAQLTETCRTLGLSPKSPCTNSLNVIDLYNRYQAHELGHKPMIYNCTAVYTKCIDAIKTVMNVFRLQVRSCIERAARGHVLRTGAYRHDCKLYWPYAL